MAAVQALLETSANADYIGGSITAWHVADAKEHDAVVQLLLDTCAGARGAPPGGFRRCCGAASTTSTEDAVNGTEPREQAGKWSAPCRAPGGRLASVCTGPGCFPLLLSLEHASAFLRCQAPLCARCLPHAQKGAEGKSVASLGEGAGGPRRQVSSAAPARPPGRRAVGNGLQGFVWGGRQVGGPLCAHAPPPPPLLQDSCPQSAILMVALVLPDWLP